MKKSRISEEQIAYALRMADPEGSSVSSCCKLAIT